MIDAGEVRALCDWLIAPHIDAMRRYLATGRLDTGEAQRRRATVEQRIPPSWREALDAARRSLGNGGDKPGGTIPDCDPAAFFELLAALGGSGASADRPDPDPPPLISITMPCWNRAGLVGEAIRSVLAQTWRHWELIVVDDGSTDGSASVVAGFGGDPRIRCLRQEHAGVCAARNRGLASAHGDIVAYLDSDDLWFPDYLAALAQAFAADPDLGSAYAAVAYDARAPGKYQVRFRDFDRPALLAANYISMIAFAHRRELIERFGSFDTHLSRLVDWDLILRYTAERPPRALPMVAGWYRTGDWASVSTTEDFAYHTVLIRRKWTQPIGRRLRVLYALPQGVDAGPDLDAEIGFMRARGVEIHRWSEIGTAGAVPDGMPAHGGSLAEASAALRPDIVHLHARTLAAGHVDLLGGLDAPVTIRASAADCPPGLVVALADLPQVRRIYLPSQAAMPESCAFKLRFAPVVFDGRRFAPARAGNPRLVVALASAGPEDGLDLVPHLARRLPGHRFVLALPATGHGNIRRLNERLGRPAEIRVGLQPDEFARLLGEAAISLHPQRLEDGPAQGAAAIGAAMAAGAYVIARRSPEAEIYIRRIGALFDDAEAAAAAIAATESWGEAEWMVARRRSVDRAYRRFAAEVALPPILDEWLAIAGRQ